MIKIGFVGGRGYLASNLISYYHQNYKEKIRITVIDSQDLTDINSLTSTNWNLDFVIILAGATGTMSSFDDPIKNTQNNNFILLNTLKLISDSPYRPTVIFPSSRLVYKGSPAEIGIKDQQEALTIYAANKIACEQYLNAYRVKSDIPNIILRLGVPYGNIDNVPYGFGTISSFLEQAQNKGKIRIFGDGSQIRTFTHIEDFAEYLYDIISIDRNKLSTIANVPGENLSLKNAAILIAEKYGSEVVHIPWDNDQLRIESGSTAFSLSTTDTLINYKLKHRLLTWVDEKA